MFSHGWPLNSDSWEAQMLFLASSGFRCIAHDRRGHWRSTQTWDGNEMDTYADDLAVLMDTLDLREATLVGFSTGGGEVARYIGRHGTARGGQGGPRFRRSALHAPDGGQSGRHRNALECIAAFSATEFRPDLAAFDVPTLVIHGDDDQVVPFEVGGAASAAMVRGATLKIYPAGPHGLTDTHKDQLGQDLLEFLKA